MRVPRWVAWFSAGLLMSALLLVVAHVADLQTFVQVVRAASPAWLAAAAACQAATYACAAGVWRIVLREAGTPLRFASLLKLAFLELFANQAMPTGGLSGSVMVVAGLRRRGVPAAVAASALLMAALSYYLAYLAVALLALFFVWRHGALSATLQLLFLAFLGVILLLAVAVGLLLRRRGDLISTAARHWPAVGRISALLRDVEAGPFRKPPLVIGAVLLQGAVFLLDSVTLWCAAMAVGGAIGPTAAFASFVFASVAATLSPLPLGLGTFEGTCVALLHLAGAGVESSLAATLVLRGLALWLPMLPGLWLVRREGLPAP